MHGTVLLPTLIWSSEENVYHPDDLLVDRLYDGQDVRVVLGQKQPLDERSEPDFTAWQLLACRCSNEWRGKRAIAEKKLQEQRGKRGAVCLTPEEQEKLRVATVRAASRLAGPLAVISVSTSSMGYVSDMCRPRQSRCGT